MARWRLREKHYLRVPGTEWEYREVTMAGRQGRKIFQVPLYLDPEDPGCHNYPGEIIVADKPYNRDYVFEGPPTPEMEPLDDEAEAISKAESVNWVNPIESLPGTYNQSLLEHLEKQVAELQVGQRVAPVSGAGVG